MRQKSKQRPLKRRTRTGRMAWTPHQQDEKPLTQPCRTGFVTRPGAIHGVRRAAAKDAELYSGKQFILATAGQRTRSLGVMLPAEWVPTSHSSAPSGVITSFCLSQSFAMYSQGLRAGGGSWARKGTPAFCVGSWLSCFDLRGESDANDGHEARGS
jgi:hypothetical protein